jgi:hypothetical protein
VVIANVNMPYTYQATATDPDGDAPRFSRVSGPQGLTINASTGLVSWTPSANQVGTASVSLKVADAQGGTALQSYTINVQQQVGNHSPLIISDPVTQYNLPPASNSSNGNVSPQSIQLTLAPGQVSNQTVSLGYGLAAGIPLTLGDLVTGNLATPGEQDSYTFKLATKALVNFNGPNNDTNFLERPGHRYRYIRHLP